MLDAGLVGLPCVDPQKPAAATFQAWLSVVIGSTVVVRIADVTRYEVRRELIRLGATVRLRRFDRLCVQIPIVPVTSEAWDRAGDFWAIVRRVGKPTASPEFLDADAILAGVAATMGGPDDRVIIVTTNVRHLAWFPGIDARDWQAISPRDRSIQ